MTYIRQLLISTDMAIGGYQEILRNYSDIFKMAYCSPHFLFHFENQKYVELSMALVRTPSSY